MTLPKDPEKAALMRKRISESHKDKHPTEETRKKLSEAGKRRYSDPNERERTRAAMMGKKNHLGIPASEVTRHRIRLSKLGDKCTFWKGGVSFEPYCPKFNNEFKELVRAFFGYRCVECGAPQNGKKLSIHHVTFNKKTCCDNSIPLFVALCQPCHLKTNHNRGYWERHFTNIINQNYHGKCYFTREEMMIL